MLGNRLSVVCFLCDPVIDKSFYLLSHTHFVSLDQNTYYISFCRAIMTNGIVFEIHIDRGFILKKIQWHIHAGLWSLVNCWREAGGQLQGII